MTKTVTFKSKNLEGRKVARVADVDITSYTASGESLTAADMGLKKISYVRILDSNSDNGHIWRYDYDNSKIRAYKLNVGSGLVTESFPDIKGGEFANQATGSNTTDPVNGAFVIALVTATTAAKSTIAAEPNASASTPGNSPAGRNVVVQIRSAGGGTLPADCGTATIVGTDQFGAAATEAIALSPLNDVVLSAGGEVWVVGTKIFATVTSLTLSVNLTASVADAEVALGIGTKLALRGKITAESDIKSVRKDTADVSSATYVADATYHALDMGANIADDVDIIISYDALASSLADREAASTADVGQCRIEMVGV